MKKREPFATLVVRSTVASFWTAIGVIVGPRASTVAARHEPARSGDGMTAVKASCVGNWKTVSGCDAPESGLDVAINEVFVATADLTEKPTWLIPAGMTPLPAGPPAQPAPA